MDLFDIAETCKILGAPARLQILEQIRVPRQLKDVHVRPTRGGAVAASRQAVSSHVKRMQAAGLVKQHTGAGGAIGSDRSRLWMMAEAFRALASLHGGGTHDGTIAADAAGNHVMPPGPRIVLTHGALTGRAYALAPGKGPWIIGRGNVAINLDYDPFVSREHAVLGRERNQYWIEPALTTSNPTAVNWRELDDVERHPLASGDIIQVGSSTLVAAGLRR